MEATVADMRASMTPIAGFPMKTASTSIAIAVPAGTNQLEELLMALLAPANTFTLQNEQK